MLAKKFKVAEEFAIKRILTRGGRVFGKYLQFRYAPGRKAQSRFAVIISKKHSPKATQRNFIRRKIYEAIRLNWKLLPKKCYDVVVLCAKNAKEARTADIKKDFITFIKRIAT